MTLELTVVRCTVIYMNRNHRRRRLGAIERDVLEELSAGDMLYGMLLSGRSTRRMFKLARERATHRYRRNLAIQRLQELDYIRAAGERLTLTGSGHSALGTAADATRQSITEAAWDGKWRIVAFDIPEKYRDLRAKVRHILRKAGFMRLQHSIWIFPHECKELVGLIKTESRLSQYILYGTLQEIEGSKALRTAFNVK